MTPYEEEKQIYRGWTHEELEELMAPLRARITELEQKDVLREAAFDCYVEEQRKDKARVAELEAEVERLRRELNHATNVGQVARRIGP